MKVDIFCEVIDNFGDIGVVYRFAKGLKERNITVRIFINRLEELSMINKGISMNKFYQEKDGISYINYTKLNEINIKEISTSEVIVEAFGCTVTEVYMKEASQKGALLINLEYLSAEEWVSEYHTKESLSGIRNIKKYFFMQGFRKDTGGIITDKDYNKKVEENKKNKNINNKRNDILEKVNNIFKTKIVNTDDEIIIGTIFTYEFGFENFIKALLKIDKKWLILIFGEKSKKSFENIFFNNVSNKLKEKEYGFSIENIEVVFMPFLNQEEYDEFLIKSDFNIVRGEESFVRAIFAEKPFVWQAYLQEEGYQINKTDAFVKFIEDFFEEKEKFEILKKIFKALNERTEDIFSNEADYDTWFKFFENFEEFKKGFETLRNYLLENCDLVEKFDDFIKQKSITN